MNRVTLKQDYYQGNFLRNQQTNLFFNEFLNFSTMFFFSFKPDKFCLDKWNAMLLKWKFYFSSP